MDAFFGVPVGQTTVVLLVVFGYRRVTKLLRDHKNIASWPPHLLAVGVNRGKRTNRRGARKIDVYLGPECCFIVTVQEANSTSPLHVKHIRCTKYLEVYSNDRATHRR